MQPVVLSTGYTGHLKLIIRNESAETNQQKRIKRNELFGVQTVSNSPIDLLKSRMANAMAGAVSDVATSAVTEGTELLKNGIKNKLHGIMGGASVVANPKKEETDDEEETEEEVDDEDLESPIPIAFNAFGKARNLECAVAVWKLWGTRDSECDEDMLCEPDIIAVFKNGLAFCGSMTQLQEFCENNDLDEDVDVYGLDSENEYDSEEIDSIKVSKDIMAYVTAYLVANNIDESEEAFRGFHWDENATVTKVVQMIPFMEKVPLTMCGVAQAIIYTAKKNGKVETYIHEFGEDSGEKPLIYALPTPENEKWPRSLLIHGGNMRVENRGIVD